MQREKPFCFIQRRQGGPGIALRNIVEPVKADGFKIRLRDAQQIGSPQQGADITGPDGQGQTVQKALTQGGQIIIGCRRRGRCGPAETVKGRTAPPRPPQGPARQPTPGRHLPHRHPVGQRQRHSLPALLAERAGL